MVFTIVSDNGALYRVAPDDRCVGGWGLRIYSGETLPDEHSVTLPTLIFGGELPACLKYIGTREIAVQERDAR